MTQQKRKAYRVNTVQHWALYTLALNEAKNGGTITCRNLQDQAGIFRDSSSLSACMSTLYNMGLVKRNGKTHKTGGREYMYKISLTGLEELDNMGIPTKTPSGDNWDITESRKVSIKDVIGKRMGKTDSSSEEGLTALQPKRREGEITTNGVEDVMNGGDTVKQVSVEKDSIIPSREELATKFEDRGLQLYAEAVRDGSLTLDELYAAVENLQ